MELRDILRNIDYVAYLDRAPLEDVGSVEISSVDFDSRSVSPASLFVAQRGGHVDGHSYISMAVEKGAVAVVCEVLPEEMPKGVIFVLVKDSSEALGIAASNFYGNPSHKICLIGITGTNGKTTTVTLLHRLFRNAGMHVGLLSTIVNRVDDEEFPATHTTPDAVELNRMLALMVERGCQYCFMEVSSHAIVQHRVSGLKFSGAIFSNITHDHLDFHGTMANYVKAKKGLFDSLDKDAFALVNVDDRNGMVMVQNCKAHIYKYSLQTVADYHCRVVESTVHGQQLELNGSSFWTLLVGRFNAYNVTAIAATAMLCGMDKNDVLRGVSALSAAPGRFQQVRGGGITAIVDYAHTPDALQNVIDTINDVRRKEQDLIVVVGCGGDRDPLKRPIMARIAAQGSDHLVLTSDNPRTENPEDILDAMEAGLDDVQRSSALRITDRRQAIKAAVMMAKDGDIILVAGKGHETYQEINGVKNHFDDVEELNKLINKQR